MKKQLISIGLISFLCLTFSTATAQKGVWVPAGGDIKGFQVATCVYQNNLYVAGLDYQSGMPKSYIRKFNGTFWTTLIEIPGFNNAINVMKEYKGVLYVGGQFIEFGGISGANSLVKWNGSGWSAVGAGFDQSTMASVFAMEIFNNNLYVGGRFDSIAGLQMKNLAVWNGSNWSAGPLCESGTGMYSNVQSLGFFNNSLFIGGTFTKVNSVNCSNVARFDGTNAYSLSNGTGNGTNAQVSGFEVYDDELFLFGYFSALDTTPVNGIAKWNKTKLVKLTDEPEGSVQSLKAHKDVLYFTGPGWNSGVEFFDGTKWELAGQTELKGEGAKLEVYKNRLYVFGGFISSDSSPFVFSGSAMLIDSGEVCKVEGRVFLDSDKSCTMNNAEKGIQKRIIEIKPVGVRVLTDSIGYFSMFLEKGTYSAKLLPIPFYASTCTDSINFTFTQIGTKTDTLFFGSYIKDTVFDGLVGITSSNARPGFNMSYFVRTVNVGTASQNSTLRVTLSSQFTFVAVRGPGYSRINGNILEWDINPLFANQLIALEIYGQVKSGTALGSTMVSYAQLIPAASDANMKNNYDTVYNNVRGSFDPNDKQVYPGGIGTNGLIGTNTSQTLRYHVRFQNTGTDTAFNIIVIDTLDKNLDAATFTEVGSSHPYTYEMLPGNVLKFNFMNILLADSNINEPQSHGFVSFNINPKSGLLLGTQVRNNADIYFDFNDPVRTNTTVTTFDKIGGAEKVSYIGHHKLHIYPNPGDGMAIIELSGSLNQNESITLEIIDMHGNLVSRTEKKEIRFVIDMCGLRNGVYFIKGYKATGESYTGKYVKMN